MSVSGEIYEKSEETEKKEHIDKMVKWLKLNTSLKVLEEHEFEDLAQKASFAEHGYAFAFSQLTEGAALCSAFPLCNRPNFKILEKP